MASPTEIKTTKAASSDAPKIMAASLDAPTPTTAASITAPKEFDLASLKDAVPNITPTPSQEEPIWNMVVKKGKNKAKVPPKHKPPSAARRAQARAAARRERNTAAEESKQSQAAEGTARTHDASARDKPPQRNGASVAAGMANPAETPSAPQNTAADDANQQRSKKRPRGKRAGKGRFAAAGDASSVSKPAKRLRPDDTLSPKDGGKGKRAKTASLTPTQTRPNYADAVKGNDYCVAVLLEPFVDLTVEQASAIEEALDEAMDAEIYAPRPSSSAPVRAPAFRGKAFYSEGVLKMWCEDDHALSWLHRIVPQLKSPREGSKLAVRRQSEIPRRIKGGLLVPNYKGDDLDILRKKIQAQNPWYHIPQWAIYHAERQDEDRSLFLILGIPQDDVSILKKRDRRVAFKLGSIYVRLFEDRDVAPTSSSAAASEPNSSREVRKDLGSTGTAPTQTPPPERQIEPVSGSEGRTGSSLLADPATPAKELREQPSEQRDSVTMETDEERLLASDDAPSSPLFRV